MKIIGLLITCAALLAGSTVYSVINLGSLGGSSSVGYQINDAGAIVGWAETLIGNKQAFKSDGGALKQLVTPLASDTLGYGINSSGVIVGTSYINGQPHGTVWSSGGAVDLGAGVFATGINDAGVITGSNGHAFRLVNGKFEDLGTLPGGDWSSAYAINNAGDAVGYGDLASGYFRGIVWSAGGIQQLGTLGGANSYATDINNAGEVVGHSNVASGYEHAFVWVGGALTDLGTLSSGSSYAYGINDGGSIVGYSWSENEDNPHAFLYAGGVLADLNCLIPGGSGWQLLEAYGINNNGEIVGAGLLDGRPDAFLLEPVDPVPEPDLRAMLAVLLAFVAAIAWRTRSRAASADSR